MSDESERSVLPDPASLTAEERRLREARTDVPWRAWGPYLSERQWGTVREDYSDGGDAWSYFTHDQARSRAYRWGEDGLAGISDDKQRLCLALALWNERDPILKERLFGLTNAEGNHGEDVKEYYFYVDNVPTHSYQRYLYKYPQAEFPYNDLVAVNRARSRQEFEYELIDTGIFDDGRYFDVEVEYAKASPEDILCRVTVHNRSDRDAALHVLPTLWFRNTWSWGTGEPKPRLARADVRLPGRPGRAPRARRLVPVRRARRRTCCSARTRRTRRASFGAEPTTPLPQGRHRRARAAAARTPSIPDGEGTKAAAHVRLARAARAGRRRCWCGSPGEAPDQLAAPFAGRRRADRARRAEADEFYDAITPPAVTERREGGHAPGAGRDALVQAVLLLRRRPVAARAARPPAARAGAAGRPQRGLVPHATTTTWCPCPTSGSTPGTRPGTWRSTAFRWPWSTRTSPRARST